MGPDDGAVDVVQIPVQIAAPLRFLQERMKHLIPDAMLIPAPEAAVNGLPGAVALR